MIYLLIYLVGVVISYFLLKYLKTSIEDDGVGRLEQGLLAIFISAFSWLFIFVIGVIGVIGKIIENTSSDKPSKW